MKRPRRVRAAYWQILHGSVVVAVQDCAGCSTSRAIRGGLQDVFVLVKLLEFQVRNSSGEKRRNCVCEGHSSSDRALVRLAPKVANNHKSVSSPTMSDPSP